MLRKSLDERRAVGALLADGFVLQDDAADELGHARGKKHFTVGAPAVLGRLHAERIEALRQGGNGFVGCENSLPVGEQRQRDALEIIGHHEIL